MKRAYKGESYGVQVMHWIRGQLGRGICLIHLNHKYP